MVESPVPSPKSQTLPARFGDVFFKNKVAVPHDEQAAIRCRVFANLAGVVEALQIESGLFADFFRGRRGAPAALAVGRGKIIGGVEGCGAGEREGEGAEQGGHGKGVRR